MGALGPMFPGSKSRLWKLSWKDWCPRGKGKAQWHEWRQKDVFLRPVYLTFYTCSTREGEREREREGGSVFTKTAGLPGRICKLQSEELLYWGGMGGRGRGGARTWL